MHYLLLAVSFFIGSIPTGYVIGRLQGVDIRKHGSGNIGATNASRTLGKKAGVLTLVGDLLKGMSAVGLALLLNLEAIAPYCGLAAIVGHCFSPFLKFRGGKGIATGLGVCLLIASQATLIALVVFLATVAISGYVSLGSILASGTVATVVLLKTPSVYAPQVAIVTVAIFFLVVARHHENISRLVRGTEQSWKTKNA